MRTSFESQDVTRLLDSRRLQDDQFTDKEIDSSETKVNLVAESFNQGFVALSKGVTGFPCRKMKLLSRRAAHVGADTGESPSRRDLHTPCSSRDTIAVPGHGRRRASAAPGICVLPPARRDRA
jgi:hypothetical protein